MSVVFFFMIFLVPFPFLFSWYFCVFFSFFSFFCFLFSFFSPKSFVFCPCFSLVAFPFLFLGILFFVPFPVLFSPFSIFLVPFPFLFYSNVFRSSPFSLFSFLLFLFPSFLFSSYLTKTTEKILKVLSFKNFETLILWQCLLFERSNS